MIDIQYLKDNNCIIYEVISGSVAYGLNHKGSDVDIRGVFVLPRNVYYGFEYVDQVNDETNDTVYYELGKFLRLLAKNNPTILEVVSTPSQFIQINHKLYPDLDMSCILSKLCFQTFANYAYSQVKKARGLNKKIMNPVDEKRKVLLDFCTVTIGYKTEPLLDWTAENNIDLSACGLIKMDHCKDLYALFWEGNENAYAFKGVVKDEDATQVHLSSIPKGLSEKLYLSCNVEAFKGHCKEYKEYWAWVKKRNETRDAQTVSHGKNYDAKNLMHTFRLLAIAEEIVTEGKINVLRPDREYLLSIKRGDFEYDDLLEMAEEKIAQLELLYKESSLPDNPDQDYLRKILIETREKAYQ